MTGERLEELVRRLDAVVWVADVEMRRFSFVSGQAIAVLRHPIAAWVGEDRFWEERLVHPDDRDAVRVVCREVAADGADRRLDHRMIDARGEVLWFRTRVSLLRADPARGGPADELVGISTDVTEEKVGEAALRRSEERLRLILDHAPEALAVHASGTLLYVNPALVRLTGHDSAAALVGRPVLDIVHPDSRAVAAERIGRMIATGEPAPPLEERFVRRDGGVLEVEVTALPIEFEGRRAVLALGRDVTDRRRAEAERDAAQEALVRRERLAALGEISAVVAHEVRNPLGVIFNALSALGRMVVLEGQAAELYAILREEAARLDRIVVELLDFARPLHASPRAEPVAPLLDDALVAAARAVPSSSGVRVVRRIDDALPSLWVDARLVRQALINVATNAFQAMPGGGELRVEVARDDASDGARIEVSDTGPGIPPEALARVFEPFFSTRATGSGLGLAIVRRIVEEHRGAIDVRSDPGRGTTVVLRLPIEGSPGPAAGPARGSPQ